MAWERYTSVKTADESSPIETLQYFTENNIITSELTFVETAGKASSRHLAYSGI